jgi:glucuronate isomerase
MALSTRQSIYEAIASIRLIDPHTHINPHSPASNTLADLLGYHYYTELAHSAGMPKDQIEEEGISPHELVGRLVANLGPIENTAQYRWLIEICRKFFGFEGDRIDHSNWENAYSMAESRMSSAEWPQMVLDQSNVEAVFLTNDFDDDLEGFDTDTYIPCLRTDDLVFHLTKQQTRQRLAACTGIDLDGSLNSLRLSLRQRFDHFVSNGARACAISLPPSFQPTRVSDGRAQNALDHVLRNGVSSDPSHQSALSQRVFWTLAELCDEFGLPFDLMIGVNRGVYPEGVFQGQDLYDSRVSLIQYAELFNAFPEVKFPISVLASVTNQELVSYSWIFPNVITNGHWWYSNTPSFIARDAMARLEAVPQTKQIAYYSDAYKLEFVWPKFDMYRNVLAGILADHFVEGCGWSEERAIELGRMVLRDNVDRIFPKPPNASSLTRVDSQAETWVEESAPENVASDSDPIDAATATTSALAAGAIGMVEVSDAEEDEFVSFDDGSLPTTIDKPGITETVRMDEDEDPFRDGTHDTVRVEEHESEQDHEFDPLPSHREIQAVDVDDVTLKEFSAESNAIDHEYIESEADPEPLDVGDLLGDQPVDADDAGIEMLEGQESFIPDEESLQTKPNPETGEWTLPYPQSNDDSDSANSEEELLETIDLTADDEELEVDFEFIEEDDETDGTS